MSGLNIYVDGIGLWSPQLGGFSALREQLLGQSPTPPTGRPPAVLLPPNERRRAPESVLLAVEVAAQALAMSGHDAADTGCVFASSHGDQPITDYMCATLAQAPTELSPTRFHNSVHNAAVGYWTIAVGCHAPSTAVAAQRHTFGAGLLEAASQVVADQRPILLTCSDTAGTGPLTEVTGCQQAFGSALLLAPGAGPNSLFRLQLALTPAAISTDLPGPLDGWRKANTSAEALPLLALLAHGGGRCLVTASPLLGMQIIAEPVR